MNTNLLGMEKHLLSKSTFIRGLQCQKSLYLYRNHSNWRDPISVEQKALFSRGTDIGLLAQKLFPGGIDASPSRSNYLEAVLKTKTLIEAGQSVIYEATFQFEQTLVILDILVKKENKWYAYEVKSATRISQNYIIDAAVQYYVINNSGIPLNDISIVHINNQYIRNGKVEVDKLFTITSVKEEVLRNQVMVQTKIAESKNTLGQQLMPEVKIGEHCFSPYSCDFMGLCWKNVPAHSVFEIVGLSRQKQFEMYHQGLVSVKDVPIDYALQKTQRVQVDSFIADKIIVDKEAIAAFLTGIKYPIYFMDFETFMPPIPIYNGMKPYQHIPFQYSIHYKSAVDAPIVHLEFLAETGVDPRRQFLINLLRDTATEGDIMVYDAQIERAILNGLKTDFPEFASAIDERLNRIKDLMQPFKDKAYYHPAMKGSHSIKNVLPALVPELTYDNLKIPSGAVAMATFEQLQTETDMFKIMEAREDLLAYCKLDTLAMVKLFEVLENAIR